MSEILFLTNAVDKEIKVIVHGSLPPHITLVLELSQYFCA